jgi:SAM-dependent methyltransferase
LAENAKPDEIRRPPFAWRLAHAAWRFTTDRTYRGVWLLRLRRPAGAFQPFNDTREDRYPRIFAFVQSRLGGECAGRLLSFGCSTGEEVFSLRRYFPRASIKGIDINPGNIAICRKRLKAAGDPGISFATAASTAEEETDSYDAIFCMAALRHGELGLSGAKSCFHLIRFEDFARTVEDFARCLKPGGLLVIRHSNFRFRDAPASAGFETILQVPYPAAKTPIFGPDNRLMEGETYPDTVFRKALAAG